MTGLPALLERFRDLSVVVVGDAMVDVYLEGPASRLCREAPVPVVRLQQRTELPGGAANTAANLSELGADTRLVSAVGADAGGARLCALLEARGVATDCIARREDRRTLSLNRVFAGPQLLVRYDEGDSDPLGPACERDVVGLLEAALAEADAVVVSDYGYGVMTPAVVEVLSRHQSRRPGVLVVDSKHPAGFRHLRPTAVKPNWSEALHLLGSGELDGVSERADGIAEQGDRILELTGAQIAAVTLDSEGAIVFERGRPPHRTYAHARPSAGATGA
ncbi:MAG: PfkB family carbohydrate kinase, partial [Actinomycetota bacterium]|nr:PfkB family carbohydrate kinase [Actinomycetota bacterium]